MKNLLLVIALALAFSLVLTSCVTDSPSNIADENAARPTEGNIQRQEATQAQNETTKAENKTTQTQNKTTQAQYTGMHLPAWAESYDLSDGEVYTSYFHASWQRYSNIDSLAAAAERYIARVEVLGERTEMLNISLGEWPSNDIYTIHQLRVLEVFKGNVRPGEMIEVAQAGGQLGNLLLINPDFVTRAVGDELIVFLSGVDPKEYSEFPVARFTFVVNPWQTFYRADPVDGDTFKSLHPDNDLVLTRAELEQIAERSRTE